MLKILPGTLAVVLSCGTAIAQPVRFDDVVRNLRNPDPRARLSSLSMLRDAKYLEAIEPTLSQASPGLTVSGTADSYEITETSNTGTDFTLRRKAVGQDERVCSVPERGRCDAAGTW